MSYKYVVRSTVHAIYTCQVRTTRTSHQIHAFHVRTLCIPIYIYTNKLKIDQRKARERELATFDENRRAVGMLNPMRDKN